jgi:hypothetical protein
MTSTRVRVDASPSIRFPTRNPEIETYLEIGQWKFNPVSGPTRQTYFLTGPGPKSLNFAWSPPTDPSTDT